MNQELLAQIENMSEQELIDIMNTEFPEELEKQASAEIAESALTEALYDYGMLIGERSMVEISSDGDLSKVASEETIQDHADLEAAAGAVIEEAMEELALAQTDEITLHKTAQVCAAVIFDGYTDAIQKLAEDAPAAGAAAEGAVEKMKKGIIDAYDKSKGWVKANPMKSGAIGGALGTAALIGAASKLKNRNNPMDKEASSMTVGEIAATIQAASEVEYGAARLEKLAEDKATMAKKILDHLSRNKKKYYGAAAAGVAGGGYGAYRYMKKKKAEGK